VVRVFPAKGKYGRLWTVRWSIDSARKTKSYPDDMKDEAIAFARGIVDQRKDSTKPRPKITLNELWRAYTNSPEWKALRKDTWTNYTNHWNKWVTFCERSTYVDETNLRTVDAFRNALAKLGIASNQIRICLQVVRNIYGWGESRDLISLNRILTYRFKAGKDERETETHEYRMEDFRAILAQFDPLSGYHWRPWVALTILGNQGQRENAVLHLAKADVREKEIVWNARYMKQGKEFKQPLRSATRRALEVARHHHKRMGYTGPWILPGTRGRETYGEQALWRALNEAEKSAQVPKIVLRSTHGLRRMVAGEIYDVTKDKKAAADFLGVSLATIEKYLKRREDVVRSAVEELDELQPNCNPEEVPEIEELVSVADSAGYREPPDGLEPSTTRRSPSVIEAESAQNLDDSSRSDPANDPPNRYQTCNSSAIRP